MSAINDSSDITQYSFRPFGDDNSVVKLYGIDSCGINYFLGVVPSSPLSYNYKIIIPANVIKVHSFDGKSPQSVYI